MTTSSPQPLTPELVDDYRTLMTRRPSEDLEGHVRRVEAARRLATRAYREKDRAAWEVCTVAKWRLQKRNNLRPTEPGDVHVIDTIYAIEEAAAPTREVPRNLSPREFSTFLQKEIPNWSGVDTEIFSLIKSGKFTADEMRYVIYQSIPAVGDFLCMMAMSVPRFTVQYAVPIVENLWDESGMGEYQRAHVFLYRHFARHFDASLDPEVALDWAHPVSIDGPAMTHRHLWHYEPGWLLGSMFAIEATLAVDLGAYVEGCRRANLPPEVYEWFTVHAEADEKHTAEWIELMEAHFGTHEAQQATYNAATERGVLIREFWGGMSNGLRSWLEHGRVDRLPFRELREQTGM